MATQTLLLQLAANGKGWNKTFFSLGTNVGYATESIPDGVSVE